jgi:hypothetical protein
MFTVSYGLKSLDIVWTMRGYVQIAVFPPSVTFHHCTTFSLTYMLHTPKGHKDESWKLPIYLGTPDKEVFSVFFKKFF